LPKEVEQLCGELFLITFTGFYR